MSETVPGHAKRRAAEERIMQEYRRGNLTPLGVANHLRRAGFNIHYATDKANALSTPIAAHGAGAVTEAMVERACAVHAEATGYYVQFHRGLRSVSSDKMRVAMRAALEAAIRPDEAAGQGGAKRPDPSMCFHRFMSTTPRHCYLCGWDFTKGDPPEDATPRPAPVAPDIVERRIRALRHANSGKADSLQQTQAIDQGIETLTALSSELAEAKRNTEFWENQENKALLRAEAAEAEVARLKDGIEQALKNVAYKAGDHPIVPIKYNAFEAAIRSLTAAKGGASQTD